MSKVQAWVWEELQSEAQEQGHEVSQSGKNIFATKSCQSGKGKVQKKLTTLVLCMYVKAENGEM